MELEAGEQEEITLESLTWIKDFHEISGTIPSHWGRQFVDRKIWS